MPKSEKKTGWQIFKEFSVEICALAMLLAFVLVLVFNKNFSNAIITNFEFLRPEFAIIWFSVMLGLAILLTLMFFLGTKKKKLQSTKKLSAFDKTLEHSDKSREMSQTQTVYSERIKSTGSRVDMPKDIDKSNTNVVELYFCYEGKLNI